VIIALYALCILYCSSCVALLFVWHYSLCLFTLGGKSAFEWLRTEQLREKGSELPFRLPENKFGSEMSSARASGSKKRAPLRHAAIEQQMEGPQRKRRVTGARSKGDSSEDEEDRDGADQMEEEEVVVAPKASRARQQEEARMQLQAKEQRRALYEERMARNIHEMTDAIHQDDVDSEVSAEENVLYM
jgi:hypothetical protein